MPGRVTVVRPDSSSAPRMTPIASPTGRCASRAVARCSCTGDGSDHVQNIDVRDLVEFCVRLVENGTYGVFNGVGPQGAMPFREFLAAHPEGRRRRTRRYTWVDADFLAARTGRNRTDASCRSSR
jgi:2'-hydroxyisoflavone reductase